MACDASELIASWTGIESLGLEDLMILELVLLRATLLVQDPGATVDGSELVALGTSMGYSSLNEKQRDIAEIELLCQLSTIL